MHLLFSRPSPWGVMEMEVCVLPTTMTAAEIMDSIRVHGKGNHKYENVRIGINGRLDTLQAAILIAKFEIFAEEIELRQKVAGWLYPNVAGTIGYSAVHSFGI